MKITVVIPVYNRAQLVKRTLDSIVAQTVRDFAVVLVDNNSSDGTYDTLRGWAASHPEMDVKVVQEKAPGAAAARNRGMEEVKTPWVMFFDSDDIMLPRNVERALEWIERHPEADIIGWDICNRTLTGEKIKLGFWADDPLWHNIFNGSMAPQRYCCKAEVVRRAGGWNPEVMGWNDIELGTRMLLLEPAPVTVKADDEITVETISVAESITGESFSSGAFKFNHSINIIKQHLSPKLKPIAELKRTVLAANCTREGSPCGPDLYKEALHNTPGRLRRFLLRVAYGYTRRGLRGIATLLRPLYP